MRYFTTQINVNLEPKEEKPADLTAYIPDNFEEIGENRLHPAVVILPGGGYGYTSNREGEAVALKFAAEGICAFILKYHVAPTRFPYALCEALAAIRYVRENAKEFHIDTDNISVCGFSAGGHLAASCGVHWNKSFLLDIVGAEGEKVKPNKLILAYPVITSGRFAHEGSFKNLLGEDNQTEDLLTLNSLDKQVSDTTPVSFIWHTYEDTAVPVQNSMLFANALIGHNIPTELHIYRRGGHGLSLGNHLVNRDWKYDQKHITSDWIDKAIRFIYD